MLSSPRSARLLLVATVLAVLVGLVAAAWFAPRLFRSQPGLEPPSLLPSLELPSADQPSGEPSGSQRPAAEVLVAVGDIGSCDSKADEAVANLVNRLGGTIATLGDTAYEQGTDAQFAQCFDPAWGPMKGRIHPAIGNHDDETANATGYFDYFGSAAGPRGEGWYSYDLGAWHVVVLNSNCGIVDCQPGSPQVDWLRADLAKADASCLLAYWHHPRWSSGRHGSNVFVQPFWDELERAGVDVILNGHDHDYERVAVDGIQQFVVGTGGRSLYPLTKRPLSTTQVRTDEAYGALWMELRPAGYAWQFVALGSSGFSDAGTGSC